MAFYVYGSLKLDDVTRHKRWMIHTLYFLCKLKLYTLDTAPKILSADSCLNETMQHKNHQVQLLCYAYISK